ncbi:GPI ethanolamine phosphate transferase 3-like [Gigantopelta aegis]|uniref:GPI ethanolamine phosphate transferase 3-like n=1 Tax=Gigantopelta aegis TaxID=1735272 RepID=UPI001B88816A|nr:GPI ethanolamine phosphate transferase 3-like [Gigantopelta aegis]
MDTHGLRLLSLICLLVTIYFTGTLIFTKGFLLMRATVNQSSSCNVDFAVQADDHGEGGCWMHMRYKKAVIILIDALKYDFLNYNTSLRNELELPAFKNKFPMVHQLLNRHPNNARLYKFIADPPTTTLQRLKGLTTGSLPTFVDLVSNFGSSEIVEDNIINQLVKHDKKVNFIGDETWMDLFPRQFSKSFPIPSFNVKDIHVCDNTVIKHLMPQLKKQNWDVLIAHLLGVDHCGHRFGPNHPAMAHKLTQMDDLIRNVTRYLKDDTILFVFGDHGMTNTGDHGGDSDDELEAGLFVYSTVQMTSSALGPDKTVAQTDIVPTVALLLGIPIPFSSLGMVITDLFNHCPWWKTSNSEIKQVYHTIKALRLNAYQMSQYLTSYSKIASDLPLDRFHQQEELLRNSENELQRLLTAMVTEGETTGMLGRLKTLQSNYMKYIADVREVCRSIWAKFDISLMVIGIITLAVGLLGNIYFFVTKNISDEKILVRTLVVVVVSVLYLLYAIIQMITEFLHPLVLIQFGSVVVLVLCVLVKLSLSSKEETQSDRKTCASMLDLFASLICVIYFCSFFSNSFVVYEDRVLLFLTQTMVWLYCLKAVRTNLSSVSLAVQSHPDVTYRQKKTRVTFDIGEVITNPAVVCLMTTAACSLCLKLMTNFRMCREEQVNCTSTIFADPLANLIGERKSLRNFRYFFSVSCVALFTYLTRKWMQHYGNLNSTTFSMICYKYGYPFCAVCCALFWALQGLPQVVFDSLPSWQHMVLPWLVYGTLLISVVSLVAGPLCVLQLATSKASAAFYGTSLPQLIPQVYNQLKIELQNDSVEDKPPTVYGLGSVYSASIVHLLTGIGLFLVLLLGDRFSPSILLGLIACFFFLELYSAGLPPRTDDSTVEISWSTLVTHGLLMSLMFYGTGHQTTIPSIKWESAFIGFHGDEVSALIAGPLAISNTFAGHIFFTVACSLYLFWPYLEGVLCLAMTQRHRSSAPWRGDFAVYNDGISLRTNLFKLVLGFILFSSIKLLGSVVAAAMHRRHLMVWKIFAPRFMFESISNIVIYIVLFLVYLFVLRVDSALSKFVKTSMT